MTVVRRVRVRPFRGDHRNGPNPDGNPRLLLECESHTSGRGRPAIGILGLRVGYT